MADISKIKLPDNSVVNIKDARITGVDTTPTSGSANVVESGGIKEAIMESAGEVIIGTQTGATGNWTGVSKLATASDMKSGYRFTYWLPYAGSGNATLTLTFQDGTTKAINCYIRGASRLTTHIPAGSKVDFCYLENASVAGTTYTGAWIDPGYWDGNSYDRIYSNYERRFIYSTSTPLYRYKICGYNEGKIVPLVITNQTSSTIIDKQPVSVGIDPSMGLCVYNTTTNITATSTAIGSIYNELPISFCQYTFNDNVPVYKDVYLKGTIEEDGLFYLDTTTHKSWYVFAPNRESDGEYNSVFEAGCYYMFVGPSYASANYIQLKYNNPVYFFNGERLIPLEEVKSGEVEESTEFLYRKSPSLTQGYYSAKEIKGKTLVWNQLVRNSSYTTSISNNGAGQTCSFLWRGNTSNRSNIFLIPTHKYLCRTSGINVTNMGSLILNVGGGSVWHNYPLTYNGDTIVSPTDAEADGTTELTIFIYTNANAVAGTTITGTFAVFDLTLMFGAGNEPATVEEFESMFPLPYYDYNPGELISFNADGIQTVGRNLWNKAHIESGYIDDATGVVGQAANSFHTGYVEVLPNTEYYIRTDAPNGNWGAWYDSEKNYISGQVGAGKATSPKNAFYFRRTVKYSGNAGNPDTFCFSIYDPSFNGQYESYKSSTLSLSIPSMTSGGVQIFPNGMRSAGNVYDEAIVDSDGYVRKVVKRIGDVDLGTLTWTYVSRSASNYFSTAILGSKASTADEIHAVLTSKYPFIGYIWDDGTAVGKPSTEDKAVYVNSYLLRIVDSTYTTAADFKAAMSGVILYYELATPVEYTLDNPIFVGTEYYSGGIQKVLPENTSEPTTAPFRGKFGYRDYSYVEKQDKLTFDTIPTANSANPVTSGGLYTELADVIRQRDMERLTTTEITNLLDL